MEQQKKGPSHNRKGQKSLTTEDTKQRSKDDGDKVMKMTTLWQHQVGNKGNVMKNEECNDNKHVCKSEDNKV